MENITMTPATTGTATSGTWQLALSPSASLGCAAFALRTVEVQGIAARPAAPTAAFAPFGAVAAAAVAIDAPAVKRERAIAGTGQHGTTAVYVPGSLAWSPPI